jgi:hypothetical protein
MYNSAITPSLEITVTSSKKTESKVLKDAEGNPLTGFMIKGIAKIPGSPLRGRTIYMNTDELVAEGTKFVQPGGTYKVAPRSVTVGEGDNERTINLNWLAPLDLEDFAQDLVPDA